MAGGAGYSQRPRKEVGALAQLERTPKDDEEFLSKVLELKKLFQQHVRDEKKELLPAVLKAFLAVQTALVRGNIELTLENSQRLTQLSMTAVREATGNVAAETADLPSRAA
jgi:chaperonin GroEL (HSP60 family)